LRLPDRADPLRDPAPPPQHLEGPLPLLQPRPPRTPRPPGLPGRPRAGVAPLLAGGRMRRLMALALWLRRRWLRVVIWSLVLATAGYLGLRRGRVGVHPSDVSAFQAVSLAPLMPLPEEPYPIALPESFNGQQEVVVCLFIDGLAGTLFD